MKPPSTGELRRHITILAWRDLPDAGTGLTASYTPVDTAWAKIEPVGGAVYLGSLQIGSTITHRITMRHRADLTAQHVIEECGRRYLVRRVADLGGERRFTVAECEEQGAA